MFTKKSQSAGSTPELDDKTDSALAPAVAKTSGTTTARADAAARPTMPESSATSKPTTKRALVTGMLSREDGATLELYTATGWQAHTVRAALTGLRKRGHVLEKSIRDGATCYQIMETPDAVR